MLRWLLLLVVAYCGQVGAQTAEVETEKLRVVYFDPMGAYLVPYAAQCFINALAGLEQRVGYTPKDKVTVLLQDFADRGNGMQISSPRNRIFMDIAPQNLTFETFSPGERLFTFANHEAFHLVTSDQANARDERYRRLFRGKVSPTAEHPESIFYHYLTTPRNAAPRWFHEGSAVFMETWMGGGLGRAQGGYDEMMFRAMVRDGADFYDPLALVSKGTEVDFQVGANAYLYGTRFMSYLAYEYGPDKLLDWLRRDASSLPYYSQDFQRVYGKPLDSVWQDWVAWEHEFQRRNLASVREHPLTPYRNIARSRLGALSRAFLSKDRSKLYAAVRYPGRVPQVVSIALADGAIEELAEVRGAISYRVSSLAYDADGDTLFYTTDNLTYRNLMAIDLKTGESRMLLKAARIGDLAFNKADRSLWGLRTNNGFAILVRMLPPYTEWKQVHVFPFGQVPFDLDLSPDGTLLSASFAGLDANGVQSMEVRVMPTARLLADDATPQQKFEFGTAIPEGFVFSADGRFLYGSSYYTGVSNIYRYELATGGFAALSNAEVGFFRPIPLNESELLVFHHTAEGFEPAVIEARETEDLSAITFLGEQIATRYPQVQQWTVGNARSVPYESQVIRKGEYKPVRELRMESVYPMVEGYKDSVSPGISARFSDPVGFDSIALNLGYSPDDDLVQGERTHFSADFRHSFWTAGLKYNGSNFYDLFGPTKRSREGYSAYVGYDRPLVYNPPETLYLTGKAAFYGDLDALPGFQNVDTGLHELFEGSFGLRYRGAVSSIGNVDDETGYTWSLLGHLYGADKEYVPGLIGQFDFGHALPLGHSSLWLRNAAGASSGKLDDPLANAYFGGFGNNWIDSGEAKRYRDALRMPGFRIDELAARTFGKSILELNLPPLRFDAAGTPGFYTSWARPAIFATALVTNPEQSDAREQAYNVGAQLDFQFQVLHRLPMMLSFGYAVGFGGGDTGKTEFMASIKVL